MLSKRTRSILTIVGLGGVGVVALGAVQQPPRQAGDPLVQEVRQLRVAAERIATLSPQIELTVQRANAVQTLISWLTWELAEVRTQLARASAEVARNAAYVRDLESVSQGGVNSALKIIGPYGEAKRQVQALTQLEQQLRARESQTAAAMASQQAQWNELSLRLDALERAVAAARS